MKTRGKTFFFYLIYGVDREIVADTADLGSVFYDRMFTDRAVVAHDETQQAYL